MLTKLSYSLHQRYRVVAILLSFCVFCGAVPLRFFFFSILVLRLGVVTFASKVCLSSSLRRGVIYAINELLRGRRAVALTRASAIRKRVFAIVRRSNCFGDEHIGVLRYFSRNNVSCFHNFSFFYIFLGKVHVTFTCKNNFKHVFIVYCVLLLRCSGEVSGCETAGDDEVSGGEMSFRPIIRRQP